MDYSFIDILSRFIHEKENSIGYVVELGSDFGMDLFILAYKLDPSLRKQTGFFSCEFYITNKKHKTEGLIAIDTDMINLYGKNQFNPTSIISRHKITN